MSTDAAPQPNAEKQQQKMKEFMSLLPLTIEVAGLPRSELFKNFNEGQMEVRAATLKTAYKLARQLVIDATK